MALHIPLSSVTLTGSEASYAKDALDSQWISSTGPYVRRFECAVAQAVGRRFGVAVASGTAALQLALLAAGVQPGDEVIVPALTFAAPASAVSSIGAVPGFADVTADDWTINPREVERQRTSLSRAVIAVDVLGHPCDFDTLAAAAAGLTIIEDAAEAHGALYRGRPAGSFGVISIFSFHANKTITTGEGGCVLTDDAGLDSAVRLLNNHGMTSTRPYWHDVIGHNYRMTNLTAAIGLGQAERWNELVSARNAVAKAYDRALAGVPVQRRPVADWATEACWLYTIASDKRGRVLATCNQAGVDARAVWHALPDLPLFSSGARGAYPVARHLARTAFWLPTWAEMPRDTIDAVVQSVRRSFDDEL